MPLLRRESATFGSDKKNDGEDCSFYGQSKFQHLLRIERLRTDRSRQPFLLLLTDISGLAGNQDYEDIISKARSTLTSTLRETDICGWYHHNRIIGSILTEMTSIERTCLEKIYHKVRDNLGKKLGPEKLDRVSISFHVYPEQKSTDSQDAPFDANLYTDVIRRDPSFLLSMATKRIFDTTASALGLMMVAPVFLAIALTIKLTSDGPVFFRQERLGSNGRKFTFLKFRSMYSNCDSTEHQNYISKYIGEQGSAEAEPGIFKLTHDPRITPVGAWLRKSSLDELPQLINVLKGDMSLVGPRPPIHYEYDLYHSWHRRRLLAFKPGITGLWQVTGRSRTSFDDMVRLDLRYIHDWSLWLDLKILFKTPEAVISGNGAY